MNIATEDFILLYIIVVGGILAFFAIILTIMNLIDMYFYTYTYDSTIIKNANRAFKNYKHYDVQDHYDAYSKTITLKYNSKQNAFY